MTHKYFIDRLAKSELAKSKNVREQRARVFGGWKTSPNSPQRAAQMKQLSNFAEKRFNTPVRRAKGKENKQGKVIDKPDLTTGYIEHIGNPDSLAHEIAHFYQAPEGMSTKQYQQNMDEDWGKFNTQYGFKQQSRTRPEYEATALEQKVRRELGLPAHQKKRTIVDPASAMAADEPGTKIVQDYPNKPVKAKDKKGNPKPGTEHLTAGQSIISPQQKLRNILRESSNATYTPERGWDSKPSVDTLIRLRSEGHPDVARNLAQRYFRGKLQRKSARPKKAA